VGTISGRVVAPVPAIRPLAGGALRPSSSSKIVASGSDEFQDSCLPLYLHLALFTLSRLDIDHDHVDNVLFRSSPTDNRPGPR